MAETLRAIVDSMEHAPTCSFHSPSQTHCIACRLTALLDEAEKVDLVKKLGDLRGVDVYWEQGEVTGAIQFPHSGELVYRREVRDELVTWLAVNLELIKAEHYAAGFDAGTEAQVNKWL